MFIFKVSWWKQWEIILPDFLIGKPAWDLVMRTLIGYSYKKQFTFNNNSNLNAKNYNIKFTNYHERHESYTEKHNIYMKDESNIYNWTLAYNWFKKFDKEFEQREHFIFPPEILKICNPKNHFLEFLQNHIDLY